MKLIDVGGPGDYVAKEFEKVYDEDDYLGLWEKALKNEDNKLVLKETVDTFGGEYELEIHIKAYVFGRVDEEFVNYIREEVQDYDISKHMNFYIVE